MENYLLPEGFTLREKYGIKKVLGEGGFGITYLATDLVLDVDVCVKELYISGSSSRGANMTVLTQNMKEFSFADFKERFLQEARQLARFNHNNIVRVLDFFETNNTAYVAMEFLKGKTLKEMVAFNGPLNADESMEIINQLLNAVEVVHNASMLHRDIKPDNLIISDDGRVVLIDFGSARAYSEERTISQTAMVSPGFAPLEQYNPNSRKGTFTDVYSIGATMYFMLTGIRPMNVTERYLENMKAPHELNPSVNMQVSSAVMLAMEMKPEDRFRNVAELREALNRKYVPPKEEKNVQTETIVEVPVTEKIKEEEPKKVEPVRSDNKTEIQEDKPQQDEKTTVVESPVTKLEKEEKTVLTTPKIETVAENAPKEEPKNIKATAPPKKSNTGLLLVGIAAVAAIVFIIVFFAMGASEKAPEATENLSDSTKTEAVTENVSPDTTKKQDKPQSFAADTATVDPVQKTEPKTEPNSGIVQNMNYNGNTYTGQVKDGKPHGSGKLVYNSTQQIHPYDNSKRTANSGDYFEGKFHNGKPYFGDFYSRSNETTKSLNFGKN